MFSTPMAVIRAARLVLVLFFLLCTVAMIGPLDELAFAPLQGSAAIFAVAFCGLLLEMVALPWHRKNDLLAATVAIVATLAAIRGWLGRGTALPELGAGLAGALSAYAPVGIEQLRRRARDYGDVLFSVIEIEDHRRRRSAGGVKRKRRSAKPGMTANVQD